MLMRNYFFNPFVMVQFIFYMNLLSQPVIYVVPPPGYHNERLFDLYDKRLNRDDSQLVFVQLRDAFERKGYFFTTLKQYSKAAEFVLLFNIPRPNGKPESDITWEELIKLSKIKKLIVFLFEPATVKPWFHDKKLHKYFWKIYTMEDDLVDNQKYFKFYYPQPSLKMIGDLVDFDKKEFAALIACNKKSAHPLELYTERKSIINFFEKYHAQEFKFYGKGWEKTKFSTYGGPILKKVEILKKYKFCFCYENTKNVNGYITEKIFDCLIAQCVPIYLGAPNIGDYIPKNCFIRREEFRDNQHLYQFLNNMNKERYEQYIMAARTFLSSKQAFLFSIDNFINIIMDSLSLKK